MSDLYQNKYRVPSARKPDWDYGSDAAYFITICVADNRHAFGEIVNDDLRFPYLPPHLQSKGRGKS